MDFGAGRAFLVSIDFGGSGGGASCVVGVEGKRACKRAMTPETSLRI